MDIYIRIVHNIYGFIIIITDADAPLHAEMHKDLL